MSRIQLALNVDDIDAATAFYTKLFGTGPAKTRPGYANFAIADPPLKLVLLENPGTGGTLNHLGVEVGDIDTVDAEQTRLAELGLTSIDERGTTCCYAKQDKFWVEGAPNGERWEIYTVLADSATFFGAPGDGPACCTPDSAGETTTEAAATKTDTATAGTTETTATTVTTATTETTGPGAATVPAAACC